MNKTVLIGVAALVLIGGGAGAAYYMGVFGSSEAAASESEPTEAGPAALLTLDPFLTNINDGAAERYARVSVQLAIAPQEKVADIESDALLVARLRDVVLTELGAKSYSDLSNPEGKQALRDELREKLQPLVEGGRVEQVLFADFVVQ